MKKTIIFFLAFIFLSCSNDSESDAFSINVSTPNNNIELFQSAVLTIEGNRNIEKVEVKENYPIGNQIIEVILNPGPRLTQYFTFDKPGQKTLAIKATDVDGNIAEKTIVYNVARGNKVKITSLKLNSFPNRNETMDPEFSDTDINRLADLSFQISFDCPEWFEPIINNEYDNWNRLLFISPVRMNETNLIWDVSNDEIYVDPQADFRFSLIDVDFNNGIATPDYYDFFYSPNFSYLNINFANYNSTRPTSIIVQVPEENIEMELGVEWPN